MGSLISSCRAWSSGTMPPPLGAISLDKGSQVSISLDKADRELLVTATLEWDGGSDQRRRKGADLDLYALFVPASLATRDERPPGTLVTAHKRSRPTTDAGTAKKGKGAKPAAADDSGDTDAAAERDKPPATGLPDDVELPKVDPF